MVFSQLAAFPLETVSRRLQVECGPLATQGFRGMLGQIVREEGPLALYRSALCCTYCLAETAPMPRYCCAQCVACHCTCLLDS